MALTSYAELQDFIQARFNDTGSLTDAVVADCITMGEALINEDIRLRGRDMEATADLSISSQSTSLPSTFIGAIRLYLDKDPKKPLLQYPRTDFYHRYGSSQTATPEIFTIEGSNLIVAPAPNSTVTGKLLYYSKSNISSSVPALFTNHPHLFVYAASIFAADYLDDDRQVSKCASMFDTLADKYQQGSKRDRYMGPLVQRNDINPSFREELRSYASS